MPKDFLKFSYSILASTCVVLVKENDGFQWHDLEKVFFCFVLNAHSGQFKNRNDSIFQASHGLLVIMISGKGKHR